MISEGSCDTEAWSNDAENSAFITGIKYILKSIYIENIFYYIFDPINAALMNIRHLFQNWKICIYCISIVPFQESGRWILHHSDYIMLEVFDVLYST